MNTTDTSLAAQKTIRPKAAAIRASIRKYLQEDPSTCDQIEVALGLRHQTASARICELRQTEQIFDTGARRPTRSGALAIVWAVKGAPSV